MTAYLEKIGWKAVGTEDTREGDQEERWNQGIPLEEPGGKINMNLEGQRKERTGLRGLPKARGGSRKKDKSEKRGHGRTGRKEVELQEMHQSGGGSGGKTRDRDALPVLEKAQEKKVRPGILNQEETRKENRTRDPVWRKESSRRKEAEQRSQEEKTDQDSGTGGNQEKRQKTERVMEEAG